MSKSCTSLAESRTSLAERTQMPRSLDELPIERSSVTNDERLPDEVEVAGLPDGRDLRKDW